MASVPLTPKKILSAAKDDRLAEVSPHRFRMTTWERPALTGVAQTALRLLTSDF